MFYQVVVLCWAVSAVLSAPTDVVPLEKQQPTVIPIISQSEELEPNGTYKFSYETGNGIKREEISFDKVIPRVQGRSDDSSEGGGSDESDEIHVQQGSYSYTAPDGTVITVRYIADENGFQAFGDHLPRAPAPLPVFASSADKSGRALKSDDSAEIASAPVPAIKVASIPEPAKPDEPAPEAVQSAPDAQPQSSENAPASPAVAAEVSDDVQSNPSEVAAIPAQPEPADIAEQSRTTAASELTTEPAEQSTSAAEQSTVAAEETTAAAELSTAAPELSTDAAEESSTAAAEQSNSVAAEESSSATTEGSGSEAIQESSTAADQPEPAEEAGAVAAEQPASSNEESTTAANIEEPATNSAVPEQPSTVSDSDNQPSVSANVEESPAVTSGDAEPALAEQSTPESEQPASTEAALQSDDSAPTTVSV